MALLVRRTGRQQLARSFYRDIYNENDFYYMFVSRAQPWDDENAPETPRDSQFYVQTYKHDMLFIKKVEASDAVLLTNRYDWEVNTIYDQYDDEYASNHPAYSGATNLADAKFFVLTDEFNVYKCLNNNNNSPSTEKPTSTGTDTFELSDGYVWKFLYQIGAADRTKFLSSRYIPVRKVAGAGQPEFDVNGEIASIEVATAGTGYTTATVVIQGDGTGATATANIVAGEIDSITVDTAGRGYSFAFITISGDGTGATATPELGTSETPTLQQAVESTAIPGTVDRIVITEGGQDYINNDVVVNILGDGTGATASATVNAAGSIVSIDITATGSGYTFAVIELEQTTGTGTGAVLRPIISPYEGHGGNPPKELFATNLGITTTFTSTDNDIIVGNEFRQIGLVKNITTYDETAIYTETIGTPCYVITVSNPGDYNLDDIITVNSGGQFRVIQKIDSDNDDVIDTVYLQEIYPGISVSSVLNNLNTGTTGMTINSLTEPEISAHTGDVMYIDNRKPITRDQDQVETVKVILNF